MAVKPLYTESASYGGVTTIHTPISSQRNKNCAQKCEPLSFCLCFLQIHPTFSLRCKYNVSCTLHLKKINLKVHEFVFKIQLRKRKPLTWQIKKWSLTVQYYDASCLWCITDRKRINIFIHFSLQVNKKGCKTETVGVVQSLILETNSMCVNTVTIATALSGEEQLDTPNTWKPSCTGIQECWKNTGEVRNIQRLYIQI